MCALIDIDEHLLTTRFGRSKYFIDIINGWNDLRTVKATTTESEISAQTKQIFHYLQILQFDFLQIIQFNKL